MTAFLRGRLLGRRPLSIATIALLGAVVVLLLCVFLAVYRPAALALAGATFIVILTGLSDRRERARRARIRAAAAAASPVPAPPPAAADTGGPPPA
jgi:hypothetical protein